MNTAKYCNTSSTKVYSITKDNIDSLTNTALKLGESLGSTLMPFINSKSNNNNGNST